ncbi:MAG: hypothetical protein JO235_01255 [Chroococcidiopsidaceae cyanobacterium CP_BM_RX_35]|nr:hypothetical protein [Chroococcidiopsidaceae cyanobacterium CP_BM_RX_35]
MLPVSWVDLPATFLRRNLKQQLQQHQIQFEAVIYNPKKQEQSTHLLTRSQRAHRRMTWADRLARNALKHDMQHWKVQLVPNTILFHKR